MRKKTVKYTDEPIGKVNVVMDFLSSPDELVLKDKTVKVTLSLMKESVDFFKKEAKIHHTQYQKMIRSLLDQYTHQYQKRKKRRGQWVLSAVRTFRTLGFNSMAFQHEPCIFMHNEFFAEDL